MHADRLDRASGALVGLAVGDALGMPTQLLTFDEVRQRYGLLDRLSPGPADHPIAAGLPAGHVTDDTDQALIIGRLLVTGRGRIDSYELVAELRAWERRMIIAGSHDLLGPSTKLALQLIDAGEDVATAGRNGTTNGAAMRITPVGIAFSPEPLDRLVEQVEAACRPTHGTGVAIAGACAVAAAVSAGIECAPFRSMLATAVEAAALGARRRSDGLGLGLAAQITRAVELVADVDLRRALSMISSRVGTSLATEESVPAAFAIASLWPRDPWDAARHAASLGGDSDTIAAMAGAMVGAGCGLSAFPAEQVSILSAANPDLQLEALAAELLALRK